MKMSAFLAAITSLPAARFCSLDSCRWPYCLFSSLFCSLLLSIWVFLCGICSKWVRRKLFFCSALLLRLTRTAPLRLTALFYLRPPVGPFGCQFSLDSQSSKISSQAWFGWFATCPCFGQCHESASRRVVTRGTISQGASCEDRMMILWQPYFSHTNDICDYSFSTFWTIGTSDYCQYHCDNIWNPHWRIASCKLWYRGGDIPILKTRSFSSLKNESWLLNRCCGCWYVCMDGSWQHLWRKWRPFLCSSTMTYGGRTPVSAQLRQCFSKTERLLVVDILCCWCKSPLFCVVRPQDEDPCTSLWSGPGRNKIWDFFS